MEREIGETPRQHPARTHDLPECSNRFLRSRRTLSLSLSAIFDPLFLSLSRVHPRIPRHLPAIPLRENQRWLPRQHLNVVPFLVSSSFLSIYIYIRVYTKERGMMTRDPLDSKIYQHSSICTRFFLVVSSKDNPDLKKKRNALKPLLLARA